MIIRCLCATAACCLGLSGSATAQPSAPSTGGQPSTQTPQPQKPTSPLVSDATVRPDEPSATTPVDEKGGFWKTLLASVNSKEEGWSPSVGSVVSGGGLAMGAHHRQSLAEGRLFMDTEMMVSLKGYQSGTLDFTSRPLANGKVTVGGGIRFESLPEEDFFGYGPESSSTDHAAYNRQGLDTQAWASYSPKPWLQFRSSFGFVNTKVSAGRQSGVPSIEQAFGTARVEGMSRESDFLHAGLRATIDRRDSARRPRKGAYYAVGFERFVGLGSRDSDFLRFDADLRGYIPVRGLGREDSIAVRGQLAVTDAAASGQIPFYFLPRLGGGGTLRGYETSRFVDQQALVFSAEYRWQVRRKLQIVGFVDAGQVAPNHHDFSVSKLRSSYGAGLRFRGFRLDYAVGQEGSRFHIGFGPTF